MKNIIDSIRVYKTQSTTEVIVSRKRNPRNGLEGGLTNTLYKKLTDASLNRIQQMMNSPEKFKTHIHISLDSHFISIAVAIRNPPIIDKEPAQSDEFYRIAQIEV